MASFNKVQLMGNLTRDPQLKYLPNSQTPVAEFGIACNRKFKTATGEEREEVTFVDVAAFGKQGELINQYFTKGKPIFIEGRLKYDQWEKDGQKRNKLSVVVETLVFLPRNDGGGGGGGGGGRGGYTTSPDGYSGGAPAYESEAPPEEHRPPTRSAPPPQRPPARGPAPAAPAARPPADPPFGEEQQFKEDDIPF
jgi:single-strand DNA-binding protein